MSHHEKHESDQGTSHPSMGRRAEEIAGGESETGRTHTEDQGQTDRPTGTSSARHSTGVDPRESITKDSHSG